MGLRYSGRDVFNWKVVNNGGQVMKYPSDYPEKSKAGKPMNDLDGYKSANKLAQTYGGFAVRV